MHVEYNNIRVRRNWVRNESYCNNQLQSAANAERGRIQGQNEPISGPQFFGAIQYSTEA